jgi:hypothetical protein
MAQFDITPPGARVQLRDLVNAPQHNTKMGTLQQYCDDTNRYTVQLDDGTVLSVQKSNITQVLEVRLVGLKRCSELNGTTGIITHYSENSARYEVHIPSIGKLLSLLPENVVLPKTTCVMIQGLVQAPQYNGQWARILDIDTENSLYLVELDEQKGQIRLKFGSVRV